MLGLKRQPAGEPTVYQFPGLGQWQERTRYMLTTRDVKTQQVYKKLARITNGHASVLLRGEHGVGKTVLALVLHCAGAPKPHALHELHCSAATPQQLVQAFRQAQHALNMAATVNGPHALILAAPQRVTLLLREVATASPELQLELMQWLRGEAPYDIAPNLRIRLLATSTTDLAPLVNSGAFRQDLYYRLSTYEFFLPPLRERMEDLNDFMEHFNTRAAMRNGGYRCVWSNAALAQLSTHTWPENLRELQELMMRTYAAHHGKAQVIDHFELLPQGAQAATPTQDNEPGNAQFAAERSLEISTA